MSTTLSRFGLLLLGLLSLGWGLNWPIMKIVVAEIPRWTFRGDCILLAAVGLFALARIGGQPLAVPAGRWTQLWGLALCNITGWNMLAIAGVSLLPAGRAAILGYTMPVWSALLSIWLLREPLDRRRLLGLSFGMGGMALLIGGELASLGRAPLGIACMVAAAWFWAAGTVLYKRNPLPMPMLALTAWQMLLGGLPVATAGYLLETVDWASVGFWPLFGFWYNVFVALLFCYWAWNRLVQMLPVAVSSLGVLIAPVIGVFSSMAFLGEQPRWQDFAALGLVLAAIATVLLPAKPRA